MKITIEASAKEIAALVLGLQEQPDEPEPFKMPETAEEQIEWLKKRPRYF